MFRKGVVIQGERVLSQKMTFEDMKWIGLGVSLEWRSLNKIIIC